MEQFLMIQNVIMVSNFTTFQNSSKHKSKEALNISATNGRGKKSKV
jgi:hypothetical protein